MNDKIHWAMMELVTRYFETLEVLPDCYKVLYTFPLQVREIEPNVYEFKFEIMGQDA